MELPLRELGRHDGFEVTFADSGDLNPAGRPAVTLADLQQHDVVVAQRWNTHKGLGIWRRARGPFSRLVYELDDDLWHITPENWAAYKLYGQGEIRDAIEHAAQTADLVTVSTGPLGKVLREFSENVAVLPNCIPASALLTGTVPARRRPRPRIGWQGGASHGTDIALAVSPVRRFLKRFPGWDLQLNGTDYRPTFGVPGDRAFYSPWIQINPEPEKYYASLDFDIGLAPLQPTAFNSSKSGIRLIEYGARGIPAVATDCEAYRAVITHGTDGFLVRRDHEWLKYMSELAADDRLRATMGEAARKMAARHLIEDGWTAWRDAYRNLFPR
jgi:glycosyltransferase involved in cell wall biosynthesis